MSDPIICAFALGHLNHKIDNNKISACFRCSTKLGDHTTDLMSNIVNHETAKQHRQTLMSGEWPEGCFSCKDFEDQNAGSSRMGGLSRYDADKLVADYNWDTGEIKHVRSIEIRFGNECNLACRHCNPSHSSKWEALVKKDNTLWATALGQEHALSTTVLREEYLQDILDNLVPHLTEIMFSGGETLYQKKHYQFIQRIPDEHAAHINLFYVTNGTVIKYGKYDALEIWKKFKKITIVISADGVGEKFEYFRNGAKWANVEKNIKLFKAAGHRVEAVITCSPYQMFYLSDTIDYLYDNNLVDEIHSAPVQYPPMLNPRIIPQAQKEILWENWKQYLKSLDPDKHDAARCAGGGPMNHMMGENVNIYSQDTELPSWNDFAISVRSTDKLFNTDIEKTFPAIAALLPPVN